MIFGSAVAFIENKKTDNATKTLLWCCALVLAYAGIALGVWCEEKVHPHSLLLILSWALTAAIWFYGLICGLAWMNRQELKKVLKDAKKKEWISAACAQLLITIPAALWLPLCALWDSYIALAAAVGLGLTATTAFYLILHLAWYILKKNPASS